MVERLGLLSDCVSAGLYVCVEHVISQSNEIKNSL